MITRGVPADALLALFHAEWNFWEEYPKEWRDLADKWNGYQWNMVHHMVQESMWDDLAYHLTHNLKDAPRIKHQILHVLWESAPRLCQSLALEYA